jgi:O-antigen/teichoic acid export membrane protein
MHLEQCEKFKNNYAFSLPGQFLKHNLLKSYSPMFKLSGFVLFGKLLIAGLNFATIILISRFLGPVEKGICSWYIVLIAISLVFSEMIAGPTAGFLIYKFSIAKIRKISYVWALITSLLIVSVFYLFNKVNSLEWVILVFLCWLNAANTIHQHLLLAKQRFKWFNGLAVITPLLVVCLLSVMLISGNKTVYAYLFSLLIAWFLAFLTGYFILNRLRDRGKHSYSLSIIIKEGFRNGTTNQAGHLVSLINARLIYFVLPAASLGVFSNALSLAEASMMIPASLGQVMYASILNRNPSQPYEEKMQTNWWITTGLLLLVLLLVIILPDELYSAIFGQSFNGVKHYLVYLCSSMIFLGGYQLLSYWHSAHGGFLQNLYANLAALSVNGLITAFFLVQGNYSIEKGILAMSVGFVVLMLVSLAQFRNKKAKYYVPGSMVQPVVESN